MVPTKWLPPLVGAGVALVVVTLVVVTLGAAHDAPSQRTGRPTVPDRVAGYSHMTDSVSDSPPGRAVALFQHGFGVELFDFPQAVVVGADGDVYRRLDVAEDRAGRETQGDPAPMLLSPDGGTVAVGDHDAKQPAMAVVDLETGRTSLRPVPGARSLLPLAWHPDGRRLVYLSGDRPTNPHRGRLLVGDVGLLDLRTGVAEALPGGSQAWTAAFSPDGNELAVQHSSGAGAALEVLSLTGGPARVIEAPPGDLLAGPVAWSPDGRLLVTRPRRVGARAQLTFVDATGHGGDVPDPLRLDPVAETAVLGWTTPDEVLVLVGPPSGDEETSEDSYRLVAAPLNGDDPRRLTSVPVGDYGIGRFHLASGLVTDIRVRTVTDIDRGGWPAGLSVLVGLAFGAVSAAATGLALGRRRP